MFIKRCSIGRRSHRIVKNDMAACVLSFSSEYKDEPRHRALNHNQPGPRKLKIAPLTNNQFTSERLAVSKPLTSLIAERDRSVRNRRISNTAWVRIDVSASRDASLATGSRSNDSIANAITPLSLTQKTIDM
jgi:hypothetical protein